MPDSNKMVIGLTGSFGSGCSKISSYFEQEGFQPISLSQILKASYAKTTGTSGDDQPRHVFQDHGDALRRDYGYEYLASEASKAIDASEENKWIVDSIKNPYEVRYFRGYSKFYLIGVFADYATRWGRVGDRRYHGNQAEFNVDDKRDRGDEETEHGQRVRDCFAISDFVILNNSIIRPHGESDREMQDSIRDFLTLVAQPQSKIPSEMESLMCVAYATSLRSHCEKRKVGAVIVDEQGHIISSG